MKIDQFLFTSLCIGAMGLSSGMGAEKPESMQGEIDRNINEIWHVKLRKVGNSDRKYSDTGKSAASAYKHEKEYGVKQTIEEKKEQERQEKKKNWDKLKEIYELLCRQGKDQEAFETLEKKEHKDSTTSSRTYQYEDDEKNRKWITIIDEDEWMCFKAIKDGKEFDDFLHEEEERKKQEDQKKRNAQRFPKLQEKLQVLLEKLRHQMLTMQSKGAQLSNALDVTYDMDRIKNLRYYSWHYFSSSGKRCVRSLDQIWQNLVEGLVSLVKEMPGVDSRVVDVLRSVHCTSGNYIGFVKTLNEASFELWKVFKSLSEDELKGLLNEKAKEVYEHGIRPTWNRVFYDWLYLDQLPQGNILRKKQENKYPDNLKRKPYYEAERQKMEERCKEK